MENKLSINVCVCTYLRAKHLAACLQSLIDQDPPENASYDITIIDNDSNRSAEAVVSDFQSLDRVPINYFCEENRGIPFARNRALDESVKLNYDYIAFIDDDEQASKDWLVTLYMHLKLYYTEAVVYGYVEHKFPDVVPKHIDKEFYLKEIHPTGTSLKTCATNNVLFPTAILRKFNLRFDTSVPLAGGTDTKFFFEANQQGVPIYKCAEAIVCETVFPSRLKISWLLHRKYRLGITTAWLQMKEGCPKFRLTTNALKKILSHSTKGSLRYICFNPVKKNKHFLKAATNLGILAGVMGLETNSYAKIDS